jgi:hypothetical protein
MKVLSAKVKDEIYDQFVQKAAQEGRSQSELLRGLILSSVKTDAETPGDRTLVLRESLKILYEIQRMMDAVVSAAKPGIVSYIDAQIADFEKKLEFEKNR